MDKRETFRNPAGVGKSIRCQLSALMGDSLVKKNNARHAVDANGNMID